MCPVHIFQRSVDHGVIFYEDLDYLEYYMHVGTAARKYGVCVLSECEMINHVHKMVQTWNMSDISNFVGHSTRFFARAYNRYHNRTGPLFEEEFGRASKKTAKDIRTCNNYIENNAPEKQLVKNVQDYRWNYLYRYHTGMPQFSSSGSRALKGAIRKVDAFRFQGKVLSYTYLHNKREALSNKEWQFLVEYILWAYWYIDVKSIESYYDSYDNMLVAANSNNGAEHDIRENYDFRTYKPFYRMIEILNREGHNDPWNLPEAEQIRLIQKFENNASVGHIAAFLHVRTQFVKSVIMDNYEMSRLVERY